MVGKAWNAIWLSLGGVKSHVVGVCKERTEDLDHDKETMVLCGICRNHKSILTYDVIV